MDCAKPLSPGIYTRTGGFQEWLDMLHIKYTKRNHTRAVRVIGSPLLEDGTGIDGPNDTTIGSVDEDSPIYENGSDTIKIVGAIVAVVLVLVVVLILSIIYMKQRRTREATG